MTFRFLPPLALCVLVFGCSSSSTTPGGGDGGTGSGASALKAPVLKSVTPMEGALHVTWTNQQPDCDTVEGERMMQMPGMSDFAPAFSVPGTVDNHMDPSATDDMMYMYRLRCKKGDSYSDYSNQMGGNPMQGMNMDAGATMDSGMNMDGGMGMD